MDLSAGANVLSESRRMRKPALVWSPHPLQPDAQQELVFDVLAPGETVQQYLVRTGLWARIRGRPVLCTIDGRRVPRELWTRCRPKPGTLINLVALVRGGGGGGKNPIATVLSIALMVAAPGIGNAIAGAAGLGSATIFGVSASTLIGGAVKMIGGLVINSVFPPPKPNLSQAQGRAVLAPESPTYSLSGGSNRMRPFEPFPKICGRHRVFPDFGARPYNEFEGEDQYAYYTFDFGYNDLVLSDFRIGTTPIGNFQGVTLEESGGDGKLTIVHGNVDSQGGAALTAAAGWIQRTSSPNATALAVDIAGSQYAIAEDGSIAALTRTIEIEYRAVGSGTWLAFVGGASAVSISHGRRAPIRLTYKLGVAEGQYEIRMRRTSADETSDRDISELSWTQLRTYQPDTADYTGRKRVALKIKASGQLSGALDAFSAIASARCLAWNGSAWATAETSNPAWWVLDIARGLSVASRRMWGGGIPDARIDLDNLKAFGAWCASKSLTFDAVFDQQMSVFEMLNAVALCGRGTVSRGSGQLAVVWDAPDQPAVAVFSMSNIVRDSFEIAYQTGDLADEIVLSFINPQLDWQRDTVRKLVGSTTAPVRSRSVEAFGCINRDMAGRWVNLLAAQQEMRTKTYTWEMDWEGFPAGRGRVGMLAHDLASPDYTGRLMPGSTDTVLKLSRAVPLDPAGTWVTIVKPDQSFATYAVLAGSGNTATVTLSAALAFDPGADADHPAFDYKFLYGASATPGKKVKITGWKPKGPDRVQITAIDEDPVFYARESDSYTYVAPRPVFGAFSAGNLQLTEDGVRAATGYLVEVTATWDASGDYGLAEIHASVNGEPLRLVGQTQGRSFAFTVPDFASVAVEVSAYSALGRLARVERMSAALNVDFAAVAPPDAVQVFGLDGDVLRWQLAHAVDVVGYRIRFHYGDRRTWEDAAPLHDGLVTDTPWRPAAIPSGPLTFLIKPVDAAGLESTAAAVIVTDLGDPAIANVIEEIDLQALGFPGTVEGGTIDAGDLVADETAAFYKPSDTAPFYESSDGAPFYAGTEYAAMTYTTGEIVPAAALAGSALTIVSTIVGTPVHIEYRRSGAAPMYAESDDDPFYAASDDDPFYAPAPGWSVWPGSLVVQREPYEFRFLTGQGAVQGEITELVLTIDAPDIEETLDNVAIGSGGTRLTLSKPFSVVKNVQLTLEDDAGSAVGVRIMDKDADLGPLVRCVDDAGAYVAGTVDARVKGY